MSEHAAEIDVPPGTVVRYIPDPSRHDPNWCREGMAIADERGLADTYWGTGSEAHRLLPVELATVEVLFRLDDYDELDRWRPDKRKWLTYAPADRQRITHQHRLQERLFIRKGATPDLDTMIANARVKVEDAESEVRCAEADLKWARRELDELLARVTPPAEKGHQGYCLPSLGDPCGECHRYCTPPGTTEEVTDAD